MKNRPSVAGDGAPLETGLGLRDSDVGAGEHATLRIHHDAAHERGGLGCDASRYGQQTPLRPQSRRARPVAYPAVRPRITTFTSNFEAARVPIVIHRSSLTAQPNTVSGFVSIVDFNGLSRFQVVPPRRNEESLCPDRRRA
jgi:hypothetical protein